MANIKVKDDAHWHQLRAKNIGSSEVAALFGMSRFKTRFELWHEKAGTLNPPDLDANVRVLLGQHLEPGIAAVFGALHGLKIRKVHRYIVSDTVRGLGGSLDYEALVDRQWIPFEIKMTDYGIWKDEWTVGDEETLNHRDILTEVEPPMDYDLQVQHQLALTGAPKALLGVMVGGNKPYLIARPRHDKVIGLIEQKVPEFWASIEAKVEPEITSHNDLDAVRQLYAVAYKEPPRDISAVPGIDDDIVKFEAAVAERKEAKEKEDFHKARILAALKDATVGYSTMHRVSCPSIHRPEKEVNRIEKATTYRGAVNIKRVEQREAAE